MPEMSDAVTWVILTGFYLFIFKNTSVLMQVLQPNASPK